MMDKARWMSLRRYTIVTVKHVLAVLLSLGLAFWLDIPDYLSASFITVLTLQPTLYRGIEFSWQQIKGTLLGVAVTVTLVLVTGGVLHATYWPVQAAVAMGGTIGFCLYLELDEDTVIATFTVAYLTCLPEMIHESFFRTLDLRFITIGIGLSAGLAMNYLSSLFGYRDRQYLNVKRTGERLADRLADIVRCFSESEDDLERSLKQQLKRLRELRADLNDVEIDLEQIEFRAPSLGEESVTGDQQHQEQFDRIYCLKDFSHHLWSLLLHLVKVPPTDERTYVEDELRALRDTYEALYPGLVDPAEQTVDPRELRSQIKEHLDRLSAQEEQREPIRRDLVNCYRVLSDGRDLLARSMNDG